MPLCTRPLCSSQWCQCAIYVNWRGKKCVSVWTYLPSFSSFFSPVSFRISLRNMCGWASKSVPTSPKLEKGPCWLFLSRGWRQRSTAPLLLEPQPSIFWSFTWGTLTRNVTVYFKIISPKRTFTQWLLHNWFMILQSCFFNFKWCPIILFLVFDFDYYLYFIRPSLWSTL